MNKRTVIEGLLHTVTPLHVSSFDDRTPTTPSKGGSKDNHKPMMTMPLYAGDGRSFVPYYPSNGMRGLLRRRAGLAIAEKIKPLTVEQLHLLTCGSTSAAPASGGSEDLTKLAKAASDLYLGVFGGGPLLARSGFQVRPIVPVCMLTLEESGVGMVPSKYAEIALSLGSFEEEGGDNPSAEPQKKKQRPLRSVDMLTRFTLTKRDDLADMRLPNINELFTDFNETALAYQATLLAKTKSRNDSKAAVAGAAAKKKAARAAGVDPGLVAVTVVETEKKSTISNMFSFDAIPAGVPLYFRMDIDGSLSTAQVYFLVQCLGQVLNGRLGGWGRAGFGVVRPSLEIRREMGSKKPLYTFDGDEWVIQDGVFTEGEVAEFQQQFDSITAAHIEEIVMSGKQPEKKVKDTADAAA